jgi:hypothetical protein
MRGKVLDISRASGSAGNTSTPGVGGLSGDRDGVCEDGEDNEGTKCLWVFVLWSMVGIGVWDGCRT